MGLNFVARLIEISKAAAISIAITFSASAAPYTLQQGQQFRTFARDLVAIAALDPANQAKAYREVLADYPDFLVSALTSKNMLAEVDALMQAADLAVVKAPGEIQFLDRIQGQVRDWLIEGLAGPLNQVSRTFLNQPKSTRVYLLSLFSDDFYRSMATGIDHRIVGLKLGDTQLVKLFKDPQTGFDLSQAPSELRSILSNVFERYFDEMHIIDKRQMVLAFLGVEPGQPMVRQVSAVLNECGPMLKKIIQQYGSSSKSVVLREIAKEMKSQGGSLFDARKTFESEIGVKIDDIFESFSDQPRRASLGQVHSAILKLNGKAVAVKFLTPGIRDKKIREFVTIRKCDPSEGAQNIFDRFEQSIDDELDMRNEVRNLKLAAEMNQTKLGVYAVGHVDAVPTTPDIMASYMARGTSLVTLEGDFEKLDFKDTKTLKEKQALYLKIGDALTRVQERWLQVALYGSGNFHSDLHAGNMFYFKGRLPIEIDIIDAGAFSHIPVRQRQALIEIMGGVSLHSIDSIVSGFRRMANLSAVEESKLRLQLERIDFLKNSRFDAFNKVVDAFISSEVAIPAEFIQFSRGKSLIEICIGEINRYLDALESKGGLRKVRRFNTEAMLKKVLIRKGGPELFKQWVGLKNSADSTLSTSMLRDIWLNRNPRFTTRYCIQSILNGLLNPNGP